MMQLDRDISRVLEDPVLHVRVHDRITRVILAADAEHDGDLGKYLRHREKKNEIQRARMNVFP